MCLCLSLHKTFKIQQKLTFLLKRSRYSLMPIMYQVSYQASLHHQKSHTYEAGYVIQSSKCL